MNLAIRSLFIVLGLAAGARAAVVFEDFAVDPHWSVVGNGANGNDFGYESSANAGGAVGEGGGRFTRSHFQRYFADTALSGSLGIGDRLFASGKLDITARNFADFGPGLVLGYFDTADSFGGAGVGLYFNHDDQNDLFYADIFFRFADHNIIRRRLTTLSASLATNVDRTWGFEWDPNGGRFSAGLLTGFLSGSDGGTGMVELTATERATNSARFDAFGLSSGSTSPLSGNPNRSDWYADVFIDDVTYQNTAVPEPSTLVIAFGMLLAALVARCARRRAAVVA